jgi:Zn-dependent M28 family amino/carboxypeptidase
VIIIHTTPSAAYPWQVVQTSWAGERFMLDGETGPNLEFRGWATEDACRKIAELSGNDLDKLRAAAQSRDFKPVSLTTKISMGMTNTVRRTEAENVIGMLEGSDANLKKEAVIYTAHHDHLGKKGNAIYPGAIDNASGVATVLGIAKAFKALKEPIKRSVYFVFTAGEEQGLLGSQYLALHPPVSPGLMAANINIDTVGFYGKTRDIPVTGLGKSSLDQDLNAIAKEQGRVVKGEEFPEAGAFYRSDQFNLAKIGVPAVFIGAGTDVIGKPAGYGRKIQDDYVAHDYHQPTDIYKESWDMSGAIEDAVFEFALGLRVANAAQMPTWNKGDEFEAVRLKALANEVKTR